MSRATAKISGIEKKIGGGETAARQKKKEESRGGREKEDKRQGKEVVNAFMYLAWLWSIDARLHSTTLLQNVRLTHDRFGRTNKTHEAVKNMQPVALKETCTNVTLY